MTKRKSGLALLYDRKVLLTTSLRDLQLCGFSEADKLILTEIYNEYLAKINVQIENHEAQDLQRSIPSS